MGLGLFVFFGLALEGEHLLTDQILLQPTCLCVQSADGLGVLTRALPGRLELRLQLQEQLLLVVDYGSALLELFLQLPDFCFWRVVRTSTKFVNFKVDSRVSGSHRVWVSWIRGRVPVEETAGALRVGAGELVVQLLVFLG